MRANRMARLAAAILAVAAASALVGCTAAAPAPSPTPRPSAHSSAPLAVPAASAADVVRLVYTTASDPQESSATVPANSTGFSVSAACRSARGASEIGWRVTPASGGATISSGRVRCDGNEYVDSALVAGSGQSVHVTLTGNLSRIRTAYVILQPSS